MFESVALVGKQALTAVNNKVWALKSEKNITKVRQNYDEILNNLIDEEIDISRNAQVYKNCKLRKRILKIEE